MCLETICHFDQGVAEERNPAARKKDVSPESNCLDGHNLWDVNRILKIDIRGTFTAALIRNVLSRTSMRDKRNRQTYAVLILLVIVTGLASRSSLAIYLPSFLAKYAGDTLWALMVFFVLGFIFPSVRTGSAALLTIALSFGVELSQLYQAEWINTIRDTRIGALILGEGFKWSDIVCYTAGCILGLAGETLAGTIKKGKCPNKKNKVVTP
jgi:hypothetical protein